MTTLQVEDKPETIVEAAARAVDSKKVFIKANCGRMPLEWPRGAVTSCDYNQQSKMINTITYRDLEPGKNGMEELNLALPDDREFFARVEDWIENSNDPRILTYGVEIIDGGNAEPPPARNFENMKPEVALNVLHAGLTDDADANRDYLESAARFELQRAEKLGGPRQEVLDGIEELGVDVGDESGDDFVGEAD